MSASEDGADEIGLDESKAPLMDHLIELRRRLIWCALTLGLAFAGSITFAREIFAFLVQPLLRAGQGRLIYTNIFEAFFAEIKVAFFAAIMISFPIIATQIWQFVAPGLYAREKKAFLPFLLVTPVLFALGAALAYYVALPLALHFLLGYSGNVGGVQQDALPGVGNYLDFVTRFMFGFGVAFLLPVALMLMERAGLVTRQQLKRGRRYAILIAFVLAAILTPPDVLSQFLLAVPLIVLYELSLLAIWFTERRRKRAASAAAASDAS
jgi:sec-independent protein translocase protein TatC